MTRWPIIVLVVGLLVAGVSYDRIEHVETEAPATAVPARANPVAAPAGQLSSVWYCPVGSAGGGYADHTVEVVNIGEEPAVATVSVVTDSGPGPSTRLDVAPGSRRQVLLGRLETAPAAGAVVEILDGQGVVDHVVATPHGPARGACATDAADQWHFAGGITTRDATHRIALLNPFAEDAVFDVRFEAGDRARLPAALQGAIVPARSVRVIDVSEAVAREGAVATTITLRRGQVVAERLQSLSGVLGPVGSALQLGAADPAAETWFPAGRIHAAGNQRLVLYNPGDAVAEVDVDLLPHDPAMTAAYGLVPLEISIGPERFEVIDLVDTATQLGVPLPVELGLHVVSVNGVPVVAERWSLAPPLDTSAIGADPGPDPVQPGQVEPPAPDPAPGADAPPEGEAPPEGGEAPPEGGDQPAAAGATGSAGVVPVALATRAQEPPPGDAQQPAPDSDQDAPPAGEGDDTAEDHDHADVPAEEVAPPPAPTQATPTKGLAIDRGLTTAAGTWALPGTPMLPADGTTLVIVGVEGTSTVEVRAATGPAATTGGEPPAPLATAEVEAGKRILVPVTGTEAVEDLVVSTTGTVVVAVSLVDGDGSLHVLNGIPVLEQPAG